MVKSKRSPQGHYYRYSPAAGVERQMGANKWEPIGLRGLVLDNMVPAELRFLADLIDRELAKDAA